jgi:hypothetical protein
MDAAMALIASSLAELRPTRIGGHDHFAGTQLDVALLHDGVDGSRRCWFSPCVR